MCTERKATGLFVLADFLCDNDRKLQILNADFLPQFLMRPAGFTWFKIMRPL